MAKYRFLGKRITRCVGTASSHSIEEVVVRNQIFEPTEAELSAFGDLLQLIPEQAVPEPEKSAEVPSSVEVADSFNHEEDETNDEEGTEVVEELDFATATVLEVLSAVESGEITPKEALKQEKAGKGRKTLVAELKRLV